MDAAVLIAAIAGCYWLTHGALRWVLEDETPTPLRVLQRVARRADRRPDPANVRTRQLLLELELRRISSRLQAEYATRQPAKATRIASWTLAYDRVLLELCEAVEVTPPREYPPLSAEERFSLEHALVSRGRSW